MAGTMLVAVIIVEGYGTVRGLVSSQQAFIQSYNIELELRDLLLQRSLLHDYSLKYHSDHSAEARTQFEATKQSVVVSLARLKEQAQANPQEQQHLRRLEPILMQHIAELEPPSPNPVSAGSSTARPAGFADNRELDFQISEISAEIDNEESIVMISRETAWNRAFRRNVVLLTLAVSACLLLLFINVYLLRQEVRLTRQGTEQIRESADSYRALSGRILALQDAERRKVGRELHDSVGQALAGAQMNLEQLAAGSQMKDAGLVQETLALLQDSQREMRTISQLLHPPLLDLAGFVSAARAYAEEFGRRSGIQVRMNLPSSVKMPSKETELMLYRVLQESLTNVHRHAQASAVDIWLAREKNRIVLTVEDNGRGLPPGVAQSFHQGMAAGVGLAGMRERMAEFGGTLEVESSPSGTRVRAILPT